jgi:hypothetical protein
MCPAIEGEMRKTSLCFLIIFCALAAAAFGAEEAPAGLQSRIAVSLAWEYIDYEEKVNTLPPPGPGQPEVPAPGYRESDAEVNNAVIGVEAILRMKRLFVFTRGVFPLIRGDGDEEWRQFGTLVQTNTLEYGWMRINGVAGVALHPWLNPYAGVRWSRVKQTRSDIISFVGSVDETIESWSAVFGVRGEGAGDSPLRVMYAFEYYHPFDVEMRNTHPAFSDVKFTDDEGYAWELRGEAQYALKESLLVGLHFFGGRMHWDGSDYITGGRKWPENDTDYLGAGVTLNWFF